MMRWCNGVRGTEKTPKWFMPCSYSIFQNFLHSCYHLNMRLTAFLDADNRGCSVWVRKTLWWTYQSRKESKSSCLLMERQTLIWERAWIRFDQRKWSETEHHLIGGIRITWAELLCQQMRCGNERSPWVHIYAGFLSIIRCLLWFLFLHTDWGPIVSSIIRTILTVRTFTL